MKNTTMKELSIYTEILADIEAELEGRKETAQEQAKKYYDTYDEELENNDSYDYRMYKQYEMRANVIQKIIDDLPKLL